MPVDGQKLFGVGLHHLGRPETHILAPGFAEKLKPVVFVESAVGFETNFGHAAVA
jgi:hypothetical protein